MKNIAILACLLTFVCAAAPARAQLYAYDATGVKVGVLLKFGGYAFYNEKIKRFLSFNLDGTLVTGSLIFESTDCTGQALHLTAAPPGVVYAFGPKNYEIVSNKAATPRSYRNLDGTCGVYGSPTAGTYAVVSEYLTPLPFTVPLQLPLSYATARSVAVVPMTVN
ncbi:hypothetical protein [Fundidesulfovibrio agrisoli]|uniref:hypothetical protein n=1 Tax=Fundidesulfovibrio agrisoli TaxID=2922717 RepID=UPI001FADB27A|nr:hypothetical protein [Fundidesulfovibrio agrisoli]